MAAARISCVDGRIATVLSGNLTSKHSPHMVLLSRLGGNKVSVCALARAGGKKLKQQAERDDKRNIHCCHQCQAADLSDEVAEFPRDSP